MDELDRLQRALGVTFQQRELLGQSLVHRSYLNESEIPTNGSNERLEFLGDAVLGLVVAEELYRRFPDLPEGTLTEMRAQLVRGAALADLGATLDLGDYLLLGKGEARSGGRRRQVNLARVVEAVLGAVYLDQGLECARAVILRLFGSQLASLRSGTVLLDAKSRLQQLAQGTYRLMPRYVTVLDEGPEQARLFTVEARLGDRAVGSGSGKTKRQAQQEAADAALQRLADPSATELRATLRALAPPEPDS